MDPMVMSILDTSKPQLQQSSGSFLLAMINAKFSSALSTKTLIPNNLLRNTSQPHSTEITSQLMVLEPHNGSIW